MTPEYVDICAEYADILQVGTRNMQNFDLLRKLGTCGKPVLLKRGFSATYDEFLNARSTFLPAAIRMSCSVNAESEHSKLTPAIRWIYLPSLFYKG